ncbi:BTB/POZ domain-containing protein 9-like isoform X2 [Adelges cooleyi]|uniref:BTB/POZ domain-containing protein 9-like isoform X2 n=1 Tax=Adelges cooleyi TaxID=133065 RepID=UPI00218042C3|nr:BTB/POZ domain-containing protein 9-like isoform X2 [Adelges cooleyi]
MMAVIYFLVFIILRSTTAWSDPLDGMSSSSKAKQPSNMQIDHVQFLINDMSKLYLKDRFSDVVLVVDDIELPAHRFVLASRSKYFSTILFEDKESLRSEVHISGVTSTSFKILLKYIYTGRMNLSDLKDEVVLELFSISDIFGFPNLQHSLSKYLRSNINVDNVCSTFAKARLYPYKDLQDESLIFIDNHALDVLRSKDFLSLSPEALQEILIRDSLHANGLGNISRAVGRWIEEHQNHLDAYTKIKVLSAVRLPLMNVEEFSEVKESKLVGLDALQFKKAWPPHKPQNLVVSRDTKIRHRIKTITRYEIKGE